MSKVIITTVGKDQVGIIAKECTYLAEHKINILDITQSIVGGYFQMMMIADIDEATAAFDVIQDELSQLGEKIGVDIKIQHENIFNSMHRI